MCTKDVLRKIVTIFFFNFVINNYETLFIIFLIKINIDILVTFLCTWHAPYLPLFNYYIDFSFNLIPNKK